MQPRERPCDLKARLLIHAAGLIGPVWLHYRRARYRRHARPLDGAERARLSPFFPAPALDSVRIALIPVIRDPWPSRLIRALRIANPDSLERMAGMAIIDTVAIATSHRLAGGDLTPLLFHELVHVLQFRLLGVRAMVRRYVRGWAGCGYDYWSIPLEQDAYDLTARFTTTPNLPFSVESELRSRLDLE